MHQLNSPQYENNFKSYRAASTGIRRNSKSEPSKIVTLQGTKFDELAHDAMNSLINSDEIYFNNQRFRPAGNWEVEDNISSNIHNGTGDFYPDSGSTINTKC